MKTLSLWLPVALWCGLIFWLSGRPGLDLMHVWGDMTWLELLDFVLRKMAHMVEYGVLFLLARRGLSDRKALLFCLLYAISDEVHQAFVPTRGPKVTDVAIDVLGSYVAMLCRRRGESGKRLLY